VTVFEELGVTATVDVAPKVEVTPVEVTEFDDKIAVVEEIVA